MKKAYFQYYETFETILEKIKDIEEREFMRKTIINYGLHGIEPNSFYSESMEMAWAICKDLIDQQTHRREVNAANRTGKKAETPVIIKINNGGEEITQPLQEPEKTKTKKFIKPTIEELAAYIKEKKYNVNAQQFFNYYESNGWKVGRNSMKNWKATVQSWNARGTNSTGTIYQNNADATSEDYSDLF